MTVKEALEWGRRCLQEAGREAQEAGRDVQVLLGHVLGVERAALFAHPERELSEEERRRLEEAEALIKGLEASLAQLTM